MCSRTMEINQVFKRPVHTVLATRLMTRSHYCWENLFGLRSVYKRSLVKRVLHLDVSTLWVIFKK